jgi:hypothetical protein
MRKGGAAMTGKILRLCAIVILVGISGPSVADDTEADPSELIDSRFLGLEDRDGIIVAQFLGVDLNAPPQMDLRVGVSQVVQYKPNGYFFLDRPGVVERIKMIESIDGVRARESRTALTAIDIALYLRCRLGDTPSCQAEGWIIMSPD